MEEISTVSGGLTKRTKILLIVVVALLVIAAVVVIYMRRAKKRKAEEAKRTASDVKKINIKQIKPAVKSTVAIKKG